MVINIVKIGNSKGIRSLKAILEQCQIDNKVKHIIQEMLVD